MITIKLEGVSSLVVCLAFMKFAFISYAVINKIVIEFNWMSYKLW